MNRLGAKTWMVTLAFLGLTTHAAHAAAPLSGSSPMTGPTFRPSPSQPSTSSQQARSSAPARTSSESSRMWAPKRSGESDQAFFQRAAREVSQKTGTGTPGQLSAKGQAALARLARGAGYNSVRSLVTGGGVVGSSSGNSYVTYYRTGFTQANMVQRAPKSATSTPSSSSSSSSSSGALPAGVRHEPALEHKLRSYLAQTAAGRRALAQIDAAGVSIRFRSGGGTVNDAGSRSIILDKSMMDGKDKPMSWLAVSVVHEASHAADDHHKQTPSTVSSLGAEYNAAKGQMAVTNDMRKQLISERTHYVTKQIAGEARAMTAEVRDRREREGKGTDFHRLDRKLADAYDKGHDGVYKAAGVTAPKE